MKTILIAILAVLCVALASVLVWGNWGDIASKVNPQKTFSCASKTDCVLTYIGMTACAPCDPADANMQCVSPAEATRLQQERLKKHGQAYCELCQTPSQEFTCSCQNGSCAKVAITQPVVSCVKEGEIADDKSICCDKSMAMIDGSTYRYPDQSGECIVYHGTANNTKSCTYCGNGVCGKGENQCNCPNDCRTDETMGWQTYKNEQYGFEIQYPLSWYSGLTYWNKNMNDLAYKYSTDGYYIVDFSNSVGNVSSRQSDFIRDLSSLVGISKSKGVVGDTQQYFDDILKPVEGAGAGPNVFKSYLSVDGSNALKVEQEMPGTAGVIRVYLVKNNLATILELSLPDTLRTEPICDQYEKIFDHMVSTFKFVK